MYCQAGKKNITDHMSRNAKPIDKLLLDQQSEANDLNSLLYVLHTTPIIDHTGLDTIAKETTSDPNFATSTCHHSEGAEIDSKDCF